MDAKRYIEILLCTCLALSIGTLALAAPKGTDGSKQQDVRVPTVHLADVPESEPNDIPELANPFNCGDVLRPAAINPPGDVDFIIFSANDGEIITFGTDADGTPTVDTFIELRADDGTTVLASDDDSGPGLYSLLTHTAPYTGDYYGFIRAFEPTQSGIYQAFVLCDAPVVCDVDEYKSEEERFPTPVPIPDNDPNGVLVGTINTLDDNTVFSDVVVSLEMDHTFVGDLIVTVSYDVECDGQSEASARVLCRPGRDFCEGPGSPFGCGSDLSCNNTYFFSDAGDGEVGFPPLGCGAATVPGGCFLPNATGDPLSVFDGLRKGGCFTLHVVDNAGADLGAVCAWAVYTLNDPAVPVEPATWGRIKALNR